MGLDLSKHLSAQAEAPQKEEKKVEQATVVYERKVDDFGRSSATGKRKRSVVRVWLSEGKGAFTINGKDAYAYLKRRTHQIVFQSPFSILSRDVKTFDVRITASGGGMTGQAEAMRLGLAKAFVLLDPSTRPSLKAAGFLSRDNRVVERKKFGQKKARKRFQFSKR